MTKYIFFLLIALNSFGQIDNVGVSDTLKCEQSLFKNTFMINGKKISKKEAYKVISSNSEAGKVFNKSSKKLLPLSCLATVGGMYLTISGIKGSNGSQIINNEVKTYKVRSFTKTIVGIGLLTGAVCFLEYSNDLLKTSVNMYNGRNKVSGNLGLSANGIGLTLKF